MNPNHSYENDDDAKSVDTPTTVAYDDASSVTSASDLGVFTIDDEDDEDLFGATDASLDDDDLENGLRRYKKTQRQYKSKYVEVGDTDSEDGGDDFDLDAGKLRQHQRHPLAPRQQPPNRSLLRLCGINSFAFAYGILISTFGLITLPLEAERLWPEKHALLLAIFLAVCGVSQLSGPISGFVSDNSAARFPMLGRRRPFLLGGGLVGIPSLIVLQMASARENLPLYLVSFFAAMLALNVMYTAYSGALTDLVNEDQRGFANGLMGAFTVLGASIGFGFFSWFLTVHTGYYFYLLVLTVAVFISFFAYKDDEDDTTTAMYQLKHLEHQPVSWTWQEILDCYWIDPKEHHDFFLVFVSRTLYYMGISAQTFMLFYFRDIILSDDPQADVSYLALVGQLSGAIVCIPMGMLSNRVGRKSLIYLSSVILVSTYIMFMFCRTRHAALIAGAIYGIGNGAYLSVDYALACDTLPSKDNAARYLGIWGVGAFIGTLLGPLLIGPALLLLGDKGRVDADGTPMYDISGYIAVLVIGCACLTAGAAVLRPIKSAR